MDPGKQTLRHACIQKALRLKSGCSRCLINESLRSSYPAQAMGPLLQERLPSAIRKRAPKGVSPAHAMHACSSRLTFRSAGRVLKLNFLKEHSKLSDKPTNKCSLAYIERENKFPCGCEFQRTPHLRARRATEACRRKESRCTFFRKRIARSSRRLSGDRRPCTPACGGTTCRSAASPCSFVLQSPTFLPYPHPSRLFD